MKTIAAWWRRYRARKLLRRLLALDALVLALCCVCWPAWAGTVLYSNEGPGFFGDSPGSLSPGPDAPLYTTFVATGSGSLASIQVALSLTTAGTVSGELFTDDGSGTGPGTVLETWSPSSDGTSAGLFTFTSAVNPLLTAGTQYWFGLGANSGNGVHVLENDEGVTGGYWINAGGGPYEELSNSSPTIGIDLNSSSVTSTPEPPTAVLTLCGCSLLALYRSGGLYRPHAPRRIPAR
jgi:hypothetical protein